MNIFFDITKTQLTDKHLFGELAYLSVSGRKNRFCCATIKHLT
jgi:hypothetical protein